MKFENKVCVVTGGAQGIGRAICLAFAREGADVLLGDILVDKAKQLSEEIRSMGRKSVAVELDVAKSDQIRSMVKTAMDTFGKIDILVNCAGIFTRSPLEDLPEEDWDRVISVNLKGTFISGQAVAKEMIRQGGGTIVNIASMAGHAPLINLGAYSPSKAAVIMLTKMMACEWAKYNIRVNSLSPGPTNTPLFDKIYEDQALRKARIKAIPAGRFAETDEIAKAAVFLASDDAGFVTGASLVVDGGSVDSMSYLMGMLTSLKD